MAKKKQLILEQPYIGTRSNNRKIMQGTYDWDDPALFGLAEHLAYKGFGKMVYVDVPEPKSKSSRKGTKPDEPRMDDE